MNTLKLNIAGMSCMNCVAQVENMLKDISGVKVKTVGLDEPQAIVEVDSDQLKDEIKQAFEKSRFKLSVQS
jgi:copper chaperone CopZ